MCQAKSNAAAGGGAQRLQGGKRAAGQIEMRTRCKEIGEAFVG